MEPPGKKAKLEVTGATANADAIRRFEAEGTLGVDVADGTVMVHSAWLGLASPVFAAMLCTDMHEKRQQKLNLPDKSKADLQIFLEFVRPGSRKRVDSATVDSMLPWFDEYQVNDLKEECQTLLETLPVDSQRLLQADRFGLTRQYQRCLKELSFQDYKTNFADLTVVPAVIRDLRPHIEAKQPSATRVSALVANFIEKGVDLKEMAPLIGMCLTHDDGTDPLMDDAMLLLSDLSRTSDPVHVAASMIELFLPKRKAVQQSLIALAKEARDSIPRFDGRGRDLVHTGSQQVLKQWAYDKIAAAARLS